MKYFTYCKEGMSKILRMRKFREIIGLSQTALAQEVGVTLKTLQNYEKGKTDIPSEVISCLCEKFYLNAHWLITGEGQMYRQDTATATPEPSAGLSKREQKMLEMLRRLPEDEQQRVEGHLQEREQLVKMQEKVREMEKIFRKSA